ncbi:hypothetical protein IZT76_03550 [Helicobacter pylori]|nr:hypothetical protein [Helicobacter pylori]
MSLKIEDNRSNSLGNGAKKLLTNADLESSHQKIVIDSMKSTFNEFDEAEQEQIAWLKERIRVLEEDY